MTTASIFSDLHLHFGNFKTKAKPDITIIAGDSCEGKLAKNTYSRMLNAGHTILFVCGNHEYYGNRFSDVNDIWAKFDDDNENFHFLNNKSITINGQRYCGTTLWGHIPEDISDKIKSLSDKDKLNDFDYIYLNNKSSPITIDEYNTLNSECVSFLNNSLQKDDVLILHHAPSFRSIAKKFSSDIRSFCYACDIEELISNKRPKLVVHGHTHKKSNYLIDGIPVISNPRGYVGRDGYNEHFVKDLVIDLDALPSIEF